MIIEKILLKTWNNNYNNLVSRIIEILDTKLFLVNVGI